MLRFAKWLAISFFVVFVISYLADPTPPKTRVSETPVSRPTLPPVPQSKEPIFAPPHSRPSWTSDEARVANIINEQFGRVCDAKIEGFFRLPFAWIGRPQPRNCTCSQ